MTPAEAQVELRAVADQLLAVEDRLRAVWEAMPRSPDEDDMFEGRIPWDLATELRATVECLLDLIRPAIDASSRGSEVNESELNREFRSRRP